MTRLTRLKRQKGFTLVEILIAVTLLGILSISLSPTFRTFMAAKDISYRNNEAATNQKISAALLQYADSGVTPPGTLPPPCSYSTGKAYFTLYNPTYTTIANCVTSGGLKDYLLQQGVSLGVANDDGTSNHNLRVYQRAAGLTQTAYLFYQSGPQVYLNYDYGVVYTTNCGQAQPCNQTTATSSLPPTSQAVNAGETGAGATTTKLSSTNISTWAPGVRDLGVTYVSTLPLQKKLLQTTADQLDRLRTSFVAYFAAMQAASATPTINFYPQPTSVARRLVAGDPTLNQGCREGWYALDDTTIDILPLIGMGGGPEFGRTAWGASIEYCRDYDPTFTSGYGVAPHFAALRINRSVSMAYVPDSTSGGALSNVIISF